MNRAILSKETFKKMQSVKKTYNFLKRDQINLGTVLNVFARYISVHKVKPTNKQEQYFLLI